MNRFQLRQILPPGLEHYRDRPVVYLSRTDQLKRIADDVGVPFDASRWFRLDDRSTVFGQDFVGSFNIVETEKTDRLHRVCFLDGTDAGGGKRSIHFALRHSPDSIVEVGDSHL